MSETPNSGTSDSCGAGCFGIIIIAAIMIVAMLCMFPDQAQSFFEWLDRLP